ncbi:RSC1 [Cyberlindnera jadinii]|uniref:RSC1 protein n=1 Tax=Cyberlindnera jadinii (strain ATCC 18201 / CBS 1600 / BCRC 20928 / JCM 3617 / NBRC 0987 / NRRL Y-1542) TaxID=983966 RepID=A0A0H5BYD3_CYBJN|nr:RSC1 [Cyberlindnera jadinii]
MSTKEQLTLTKRIRGLYQELFDLTDPESGEPIQYIFNVVPDKKHYPDYYTFIKAPTSFNSIKKRLNHYQSPNEFIKDLVQIVWNARTYNEKESFVCRYAQVLDDFIKNRVMPKFASAGYDVGYPDLSPIEEGSAGVLLPYNYGKERQSTPSPTPVMHQQTMRLITTTPRSVSRASVRSTPMHDEEYEEEEEVVKKRYTHKEQSFKRGRPPVIDKPYEQRIKNVLRNLRREKGVEGDSLTLLFERLPDPRDYPDYYKSITQPISLDEIKKKIKQRKYKEVEPFVQDMKLMIANAKYYNDESSTVYKNTLLLEKWFVKFLEAEMKKPDSDFISHDSLKLPLEQLELRGKLYKIGDWILINNPNDAQKPIVAQLFRIWQTQDGQRWINVCWYLRPEQTVHRVDRLFYDNEVFKSGQYRDHLADEILGKCYVAYFTRYQRGDPAIPYEGPLFICEYRYNDNDKNFNKIRTWRACLPDEIRDHEDPITPLPSLRRFKKIESPLKHLLPPNATPHMPIPEPIIGAPNAPPLHGAVYLRDVDPTDDLGQYASSRNCPKYIIRPNDPPMDENDASLNTPLGNYTRNVVSHPQPPAPVYHATPSLTTVSTASTFTVPIALETATSGVLKMDVMSNKRRLGGLDVHSEGPVIWFKTPGVLIPNRTVVNVCGDFGQADEDGQVNETIPGSGLAGVVRPGNSAAYLAWKKQKLEG